MREIRPVLIVLGMILLAIAGYTALTLARSVIHLDSSAGSGPESDSVFTYAENCDPEENGRLKYRIDQIQADTHGRPLSQDLEEETASKSLLLFVGLRDCAHVQAQAAANSVGGENVATYEQGAVTAVSDTSLADDYLLLGEMLRLRSQSNALASTACKQASSIRVALDESQSMYSVANAEEAMAKLRDVRTQLETALQVRCAPSGVARDAADPGAIPPR